MHPQLPKYYDIEDAGGVGWPAWLQTMWWRDVWLTFEATGSGTLPPFMGSSIRGALGHLFRRVLCERGGCAEECAQPAACRYFSLFEEAPGGMKPYIVLAPLPVGLEEIVRGGEVQAPWASRAGVGGAPGLSCDVGLRVAAGCAVRFGLRFVGAISNALPAIVAALAAMPFSIAGCGLRLESAEDARGRRLFDARAPEGPPQMPIRCFLAPEAEEARRIRVQFLTPAMVKVGSRTTFDAADIASRFVTNCVASAVRMQYTCSGVRPPFVECAELSLAGHRLFRYELPRHSARQKKWLDFDGVVGSIDLAVDARAAMPWIRAAEIFHFGQKAAFGLGRIRVIILE